MHRSTSVVFGDEQQLQRGCCTDATCDVVLFEGVAVDLVLVGTVLLQPFADILLGPQSHWFRQLHISWLRQKKNIHQLN